MAAGVVVVVVQQEREVERQEQPFEVLAVVQASDEQRAVEEVVQRAAVEA